MDESWRTIMLVDGSRTTHIPARQGGHWDRRRQRFQLLTRPWSLETWLIHVSDTTHSCQWHDSFKCVTWLIYRGDIVLIADSSIMNWEMTHPCKWHDSFMPVTWPIHVCDTHDVFMCVTYERRDSFICYTQLQWLTRPWGVVTWLIHVGDITYSYASRDSFMCVTNARHDSFIWYMSSYMSLVCDMTHIYIYMNIYHTPCDKCATWLIHMSDMTHSRGCHNLLTEEIRLNIFGSADLPNFRVDLLSDGDSVYSREILLKNLGIPVETFLIYTGTPVKTSWKCWQS